MSASVTMAEAGFIVRRGQVAPPLLRSINALMRTRAARVMAALGDKPIGLGSVNGYDELVQRSHNRWDVPLSENDLVDIWGPRGSVASGVPWLDLVQATLGPSATPSFCGVVFSSPGCPPQQWHIDSPHEAPDHRPAHAVNVLVALGDIPLEMGPTEVAPGTHRLTNHMHPERSSWLSRDDLLYQTEIEYTPEQLAAGVSPSGCAAQPNTAAACRETEGCTALSAGDCLIFDDRILHRGMANNSEHVRWVAYFSYMRPREGLELVEDTHFQEGRGSLFPT